MRVCDNVPLDHGNKYNFIWASGLAGLPWSYGRPCTDRNACELAGGPCLTLVSQKGVGRGFACEAFGADDMFARPARKTEGIVFCIRTDGQENCDMEKMQIGLLNPGAMGISVAASAQNSGHQVFWASQGRSAQTRERAQKYGLSEVNRLEELCDCCGVILSVCPPHAASQVAQKVRECSYQGLYADLNAISPQRVKAMEQSMQDAGISFVDGGIIGPPAWKPNATWVYLSGEAAPKVAGLFEAGPLQPQVLGPEIGKASAMKMVYSANTKGTTALLCATVALAEKMGVLAELEQQWTRKDPDNAAQVFERVRKVTAKAWRFSGEMTEIADTFGGAGLPAGFHGAACQVYERLAGFKDQDEIPALEAVLAALLSCDDG